MTKLVGKPFVPGVSGNPGGRPKGYERQLREVIDGMTAADPTVAEAASAPQIPAWQAIVKRAVIDAVAGDKYARDFVADRLLGKPKQHVDIQPVGPRAKVDLKDMPIEKKRELLTAYEALQKLTKPVEADGDEELDGPPPTEH